MGGALPKGVFIITLKIAFRSPKITKSTVFSVTIILLLLFFIKTLSLDSKFISIGASTYWCLSSVKLMLTENWIPGCILFHCLWLTVIFTGSVVMKELKFPIKSKFFQIEFWQLCNILANIALPSFFAASLSLNITLPLNFSSNTFLYWKKQLYKSNTVEFHKGIGGPVT